ncbi:MAG: c-type cytochrome biogenesis protein CcsB [Chloroflexota bacterium]
MAFNGQAFGINEPTLTQIAYICYLLAFFFYAVHLFTSSARAVTVPSRGVALAGAGGSGGTMDVTMGAGDGVSSATTNRRSYSPLLGRIGFALVAIAWVSLTGALIVRWVNSGHPPYVTLYEICTMLVWGTTTIFLVLFEGILKARAAGAFVVLIIFCLQSYAIWFIDADLQQSVQLVPALRSYWLLIHVSLAIFAYSSFAVAAGAGLTYLAKHYSKGQLAAALPSTAAIEEFMFRAVAVGFPFVTLVLITGAIWAQEAWTKAWSWDPKEVWALVTWLTYAAYLHVRVQRGVRGVTMAWLSLFGFIIVLITFMGVNYLVQWFGLTSMHTYSIDNGAPQGLGVAALGMVGALVAGLGLLLFGWLRVKAPMPKKNPNKSEK